MEITKEIFCNTIDKVKEYSDVICKINSLLRSTDFEYIDLGALLDLPLAVLSEASGDGDAVDWWIYELDFGRKYTPGCVVELDGKEIDLSTADKLYDFLIEEHRPNES